MNFPADDSQCGPSDSSGSHEDQFTSLINFEWFRSTVSDIDSLGKVSSNKTISHEVATFYLTLIFISHNFISSLKSVIESVIFPYLFSFLILLLDCIFPSHSITSLISTPISLLSFFNHSLHFFHYLIYVYADLGFCLYREGYKNVSNVDISPSVISQMNRIQQKAIKRRDRGRNGPIPESGHNEIQDVDCKYRYCKAVSQ